MPDPDFPPNRRSRTADGSASAALAVNVSTDSLGWMLLEDETSQPVALSPAGVATRLSGTCVSRVPLSRPAPDLIRPGLHTLVELAHSRIRPTGRTLSRVVLVVDPTTSGSGTTEVLHSSNPVPQWAPGPGWLEDLGLPVLVDVVDAAHAAAHAAASSVADDQSSVRVGHLHLDLAGLLDPRASAQSVRSFFIPSPVRVQAPAPAVPAWGVLEHAPTSAAHRCGCGGRGHLTAHPAWQLLRETLTTPSATVEDSRVDKAASELGESLGEALAGCVSWWGPVSVSLGSNAPMPTEVMSSLAEAASSSLSQIAAPVLVAHAQVALFEDLTALVRTAHHIAVSR